MSGPVPAPVPEPPKRHQYDGELAWALDADHPVLYAERVNVGDAIGPICLTCDAPACDGCMRRHALWDCPWCKPCAEQWGSYPMNR